jgi:hypothetical protein
LSTTGMKRITPLSEAQARGRQQGAAVSRC